MSNGSENATSHSYSMDSPAQTSAGALTKTDGPVLVRRAVRAEVAGLYAGWRMACTAAS